MNIREPMQLFPALIPIFISLARFPGALRPPSYAPSSSRKEKTRARSRIMGTSLGLSVSTSRRNRVQRFQIVVPIRSASSHFGAAGAPNLLGKLEICFVISSDSVPDVLEAAAVGNWDSRSAAKAVRNNESADEDERDEATCKGLSLGVYLSPDGLIGLAPCCCCWLNDRKRDVWKLIFLRGGGIYREDARVKRRHKSTLTMQENCLTNDLAQNISIRLTG